MRSNNVNPQPQQWSNVRQGCSTLCKFLHSSVNLPLLAWISFQALYSWRSLIFEIWKRPWIGSCPAWHNGSALAHKARGPGQFLVQDKIFLSQISQLANRGHSSDNQIFNSTSLISATLWRRENKFHHSTSLFPCWAHITYGIHNNTFYGEGLLTIGAGGPHLIGWMLSPISATWGIIRDQLT